MSGPAIAFVLPTLAVGGSERHVAALAADLARGGARVAVLAVCRGGPLQADLARAGVAVEVLGLGRVTDPRAPLRLFLALRRHEPELVHAFLHGFDVVAALGARLAGVPVVLGSRRELGGWMRHRHRLAQAVGTALADAVVCCSDAVRRFVLAHEPEASDALLVWPSGVDRRRFRPWPERRREARRSLALAPDEAAVVTVANLGPDKGHDVLLAALPAIVAAHPKARLLWAGDGPERPRLERAVADRPVRLLGTVEAVEDLLRAADLFVLPSLSEGLPNALLEAMAAGVAVVASAVGGVPEAVRGDGGAAAARLVAPGSAAELGRAVVELLRRPEERQRLGEAGRRAAARFDAERVHAEWRRRYREAVAGSWPG
jgi:glycosyltransferase involved in cell wall biosynthesis